MDKLGKILGKDLSQGIMSRMLMEDVKESEATALTLAQAKANGTYVRMLDANGNTVRVARDTFIQAIRDLLPSVLANQDTNGKNFLTLLTDGTLGKTTLANAASVLGEEEGINMPSTGDLDTYKTQGTYKYINGEYTNSPVAGNITGIMEVFRVGNSVFTIQRMTIVYTSSPFIEVYQRRYRSYNQTWSSWYKETLTVVSLK